MNEIDLKILEKLDLLVRLTTVNFIKDTDFYVQVDLLSSVGLKPKEIADLLGKTANNIRVTLSRIRKDKKEKIGE